MNLSYNPYYFQKANPNIQGNVDLRTPQINGYYKVYEHFMVNGKTNSAILVLPMGVGKTGLIGLLPYSICEGRALVITPQITIKDTIVDSLDPYKADNFWLKRNVFKNLNELPALVEYDGSDTPIEVLEYANIVVINIQKLQQRFDSSLLNRLPHDFFDIIIIDEAHHSTAQTWIDTINYFSKAKVVKLTGTPYRTDNEEITGELVYYYTLGQAMANNYVKQLDHIVYIPEKLLLTLDEDQTKTYTVEEIYEMGIKDEDWVSRSVAYSLDCSERIVDESLKLLEQKLLVSDLPHKIIAVACSIKHAEEIKNLYESKGYKTTIIHSDMNGTLKEQAFNDIKNDRVQVVVNVAMLGEGYDHNYLSIAAIFRPFRSKLPYAQFIGRILRVIPEDKVQSPSDNVGQIISHKHLYLDHLWEDYKKEIEESKIIKYLKEQDEILEIDDENGIVKGVSKDKSIGEAFEEGEGSLASNVYLDAELIRKHKEEQRIIAKQIEELQKILNIQRDDAIKIIKESQGEKSTIKRPDEYFSSKRKDIDVRIKEIIVPELLTKYKISKEDDCLRQCLFFRYKYRWIPGYKKVNNNAAMLAIYFNSYLKDEMGKNKKDWTLSDYDIAYEKLEEIVDYADKILADFTAPK